MRESITSSTASYPAGRLPVDLTAADFNGDGVFDLAVVNVVDSDISVYLGNGDGTFSDQVTFPTGFGPQAIASGDLNGDGIVDLVAGNFNGDKRFDSAWNRRRYVCCSNAICIR